MAARRLMVVLGAVPKGEFRHCLFFLMCILFCHFLFLIFSIKNKIHMYSHYHLSYYADLSPLTSSMDGLSTLRLARMEAAAKIVIIFLPLDPIR